jgi:3',5'-cyclic AMP phosphodiesterase CpdA
VRIAVTADLHWGVHADGDAATRLLLAELAADPPDLLVIAGDIGAGGEFAPCLDLFAGLPSRKALVPGNHDVWVVDDDPRGDSLTLYREHLPAVSAATGFHYLDRGPLLLPEADLAVVGSMNWYDYSWADFDALAAHFPDWRDRLRTKRFRRGRHNDARFVRWSYDDVSFTAECVATFERHLRDALGAVGRVIAVTHHPPFRGLNFPRDGPPTPDGLLWDAFAGNQAMEDLLARHADRIPLAFCGHTHRVRTNALADIRGFNVGSDYPFKRLLTLDWPGGAVREQDFDVREKC